MKPLHILPPNVATCVAAVLLAAGSLQVRAQTIQPPGKLAVYFGYPSQVEGAANNDGAIATFSYYDLVIFADPLQFPNPTGGHFESTSGCDGNRHPDHSNTESIIQGLTAAGTEVFGYVSIGGPNTARRCGVDLLPTPLPFYDESPIHPDDPLGIRGDLVSRVERWIAMGVTGIFLDEAGYDFGTTRARQNQTIDHIHGMNKPVMINAWNPVDVFSPDDQPAYPGMNPDSLSTSLGSDDIFLLESFGVTADPTLMSGFQPEAFWRNRSDDMRAFSTEFGTRVATVTTVREETCDPGGFLPSDQEALEYAWWATLLYGFDYMGWGEGAYYSASWYEDNSGPRCDGKLPPRQRPDPGALGEADLPLLVGHHGERHVRETTTGFIELDTGSHTGGFTLGLPETDSCEIQPDGLMNWWPGNGDALDLTGGADGTLVTKEHSFFPGVAAWAFSFDGYNDYISLGTEASITGIGAFTIEAWIETDSGQGVVIQQRDPTPNGFDGEYMLTLSGGRVCFLTYSTSQGYGVNFCSDGLISSGSWHHVAVTRQTNGDVAIHINGLLSGSRSSAPTELKTLEVFLGADGRDNLLYFDGLIDEVSIYDRALTVNEIEAIAANSAGKCLNGLASDRAALEALYTATDGSGWTNNTGWLSPDVSNWFGVTVADERVIRVQLCANNLDGVLPARLRSLTAVEILALCNNSISGPIPGAVTSLSALQQLDLRNNALTGEIPSDLPALEHLSQLWLGGNDLSGEIPSELGDLFALTILNLTDNALSGAIPPSLGNLSNLRRLEAGQNSLTGGIPAELGGLPNLEVLSLVGNELDALPADLASASNLEILDLRKNVLAGSIPSGFANLVNLRVLGLSNNALSGSIPDLSSLAQLRDFNVGDNQLSGAFPQWIGSLASLERIQVGQNQLTGELPPAIGSLAGLTILTVYANDLEGVLPAALGNLTNLQLIDARLNRFSGSVPDFGAAGGMTYLALSSNQLTGNIPAGLANLTELKTLDLAANDIEGAVPAGIWALPDLARLDLSGNQLTGSISAAVGGMTELTALQLAGNAFTGGIPPELGSLSELRTLGLSNNQFDGPIPESFSGLSSLQVLRLDANEFDALPDMSGIPGLGQAIVTHNRLSFEDLEPNIRPGFVYSPQKQVPTPGQVFVALGGTLHLAVSVGGTANSYQWHKNGLPLPGQTAESLSVPNVTGDDLGTYWVTVESFLVPDLTLRSQDIRALEAVSEAQSFSSEGDPAPLPFETLGVTVDFDTIELDGTLTVTGLSAEPDALPAFYVTELETYWHIELSPVSTFTGTVCFELGDVPPVPGLQIIRRGEGSQEWASVATELRPISNPTLVCAVDVSGFSDWAMVRHTGRTYDNDENGLPDALEALLTELDTLAPTCGRHHVLNAVRDLRASLDSDLWLNASVLALSPTHGYKVFDRLKTAVKGLVRAIEAGAECGDRLRKAIDVTVGLARAIAREAVAAVDASCDTAMCRRHVDRALDALTDGDKEQTGGRPDHVIDRYRKAWKEAAHAAGRTGAHKDQEVEEHSEIPETWALDGNYPNPFNPVTVIAFGVPETGTVRLTVYDTVGREVVRLVDGVVEAGTHQVHFRAEDLPSGVYFYRLVAGRTTLSRSMILLR